MNSAAQTRLQRAAAARVLLLLHAKGDLENPSLWTWDAVDLLPAWCLASEQTRSQLQLVSGTMYLSPDIRLWLDQSALVAVQTLIGDAVFERIMNQADAMQLPRESASLIIRNAGIDPSNASAEAICELLMAAGSNVLRATVHPSLPREMLSASLGPAIGDINEAAANVLLDAAQALIDTSHTSESAAS